MILPEVWLLEPKEESKWRARRYKPEEIVAKLRQVVVLTAQRKAAVEAIWSMG